MTARPIPFAHAGADDRTIAFDKTAWRMGLISIQRWLMAPGISGTVTWNQEFDAFTVQSVGEAAVRYLGYDLAAAKKKHVSLHAINELPGGAFVGQFLILGDIDPEAA